MLIVGVLLLAAAVVAGVAGVAANTGSAHPLTGGFEFFGYHVHGSSGKLLLVGMLIGAVGMLGFILAVEGLRRNAVLRRELFRFRHQAQEQKQKQEQEPAQAKAPKPSDSVLARTAPPPTSALAPSAAADTAADTSAPTDHRLPRARS